MKGHNQKILLITLLVLAAAFILTRLFRSPRRESNMDVAALKVDTALVTEVRLYPSGEQRREVKLLKDGKRWKVIRDDITARTESYQVNNLLNAIAGLKPERIITRKKENWNEYEVGDSTGVQVKIFNRDAALAVLWIGKESNGNTYVRRSDQDEVFAVNGGLLGTFNKPFNDWRDKSFLRLPIDSVTAIDFRYPADSGFVVKKASGRWTLGEAIPDSVKIVSYLSSLRSKKMYTFVDDFNPSNEATFVIRFDGARKPLTTVKAWKSTDDKLILTSSLQEGVYFSGDAMTARDLLPRKGTFLPRGSSGK